MAEEKKNMQMRIGVVAAIIAILTLVAICGTFAKYVTEGNYSDSARVAKWGVVVHGDASWFKTTYYNADRQMIARGEQYTDAEGQQVRDKIVYPGFDSSTEAALHVTGKPEVATKVDVESDFWIDASEWTLPDGKFYCPLRFEIEQAEAPGKIEKIDGADYATAEELKAAVDKAMGEGIDIPYLPPNTDFSKDFDPKYMRVYWPFYLNDARDASDTALGNVAASHPDVHKSLRFGWKVEITQVD